MRTLLNYNFFGEDLLNRDFSTLYEKNRRDAAFAYVFEDETGTYAMRDHVGVCPLFYTKKDGGWLFSTNLTDLQYSGVCSEIGLRTYLGLGTTKITPLYSDVRCVPPGAVLFFSDTEEPKIVYQYTIKPRHNSFFSSYSSVLRKTDELFGQAIRRQVRNYTSASLYLSGGIDSGLIGLYLKDAGVPITAFTALKDSVIDQEIKYVTTNAAAIQPVNHYKEVVERSYKELACDVAALYKQPIGNATALAVANVWKETPIQKSEIIFFGQNSDVINNAMDNAAVRFFGFPIKPSFFRLFGLSFNKMLDRYTAISTSGILKENPLKNFNWGAIHKLTNFQLVALAGMYLRRTPVDSELLAQPAINKNIPIGNPFYDVDLIEFLVGLSLRHKIKVIKGKGAHISLDKRVLQSLALEKGLPRELVFRKKGFMISHQAKHQDFFNDLPISCRTITCHTEAQRFAAYMLDIYQNKYNNLLN